MEARVASPKKSLSGHGDLPNADFRATTAAVLAVYTAVLALCTAVLAPCIAVVAGCTRVLAPCTGDQSTL